METPNNFQHLQMYFSKRNNHLNKNKNKKFGICFFYYYILRRSERGEKFIYFYRFGFFCDFIVNSENERTKNQQHQQQQK